MKFLCPSCKAKYQIADEKIAGRTLKMDCRRCNHQITIRGDGPASASDAIEDVSDAPSVRPPAANPARPAAAGALRSAAGSARGSSSVGPAPARTASSSSQPGAGRSALGADFRRGTVAPEAAAPARPAALEQWHVAINDVPVGPMRRDEIARKIAMGAITGDSLSWREGFDDWRPVRDVPELAALLRRATPEPRGGGAPAPMPRTPAPAARSLAGSRSLSPGAPRPAADMRPAARGSVVPIGGRHGAAAAPAIDEDEEELSQEEPTTIASAADLGLAGFGESAHEEKAAPAKAKAAAPMPAARAMPAAKPMPAPAAKPHAPAPKAAPISPAALDEGRSSSPGGDIAFDEPVFAPHPAKPAAEKEPAVAAFALPAAPLPVAAAVEPKERERRGLPVGAWMGIAGVMTFAAVFAVIAAQRFLGPVPVAAPTPAPEPVVAAAAVVPTPPPVADPTPPPVADPTPPPEAPPADPTPPPTAGATTGAPHRATTGGATGGSTATRPAPADPTGVFAHMAEEESGTSGPTGLAERARPGSSGGGSSAAAELSEDQIRTVVNRERTGLTRCWETAIRGMRETPTVRLEVEITIGSSGTVTNAAARGPTVGTLTECIERNVRHWRFPASSGTSRTTFPVVFTGTS